MPKVRSLFWVAAIATGMVVVLPAPGHAGGSTIDVTTTADVVANDSQCSLREAVTEANVNGDVTDCVPTGPLSTDTINLVSGSSYVLNGSPGGDITISDDLTIDGNSTPPFFQDVAVKGFHLGERVFTIEGAGTDVTFNDFVIQDAICNPGACDGAGVKNAGFAIFDRMSLGNNNAGVGSGGAIYNTGSVALDDSVVAGNAAHASGGGGGGIYNTGSVTVTDSRITLNPSTSSGGGIYNAAGAVYLSRSLINQHAVNGNGGGIFNDNGFVQIWDSTISGNFALENGGGIRSTGNSAEVSTFYSTISNNTADYQDSAPPGQGGGISQSGTGTVTLLGTILAGNFDGSNDPPNDAPDCSGSLTSAGYNLVGISDGCFGDVDMSDQMGTSAAQLDPKLEFLSNYGGSTNSHLPKASSPAVNAGETTNCTGPDDSTLGVDQRGLDRDPAQDGICDIGAVERESVAPTTPTLLQPNKRWQPDDGVLVEWTAASDTLAPPGGTISYPLSARSSNYKARRFKSVTKSGDGTTATSSNENVIPGHTICYKVRARDLDQNLSNQSNEKCTAVPVNDRQLTQVGRWTDKNGDDHYLGDYAQTKQEGAELRLPRIKKAKTMSLVAAKCPGCGTVKVFLGDELLKRVRLNANSVQNNKSISLGTFSTPQKGTATIEVTSDGKPVKIGGLGVSKF